MDQPILLEQQAQWLSADMDTPISLFKNVVGSKNGILLESAEVDGRWGRYSVLLTEFMLEISCVEGCLHLCVHSDLLKPLLAYEGSEFISGLRQVMRHIDLKAPVAAQDLPPITRALYGYFGFGMAALFTERLTKVMPPSEAQCRLVLPATILLFDHLYHRLCHISVGQIGNLPSLDQAVHKGTSSPIITDLTNQPSAAGYQENVCRIQEWLRQGEAIQVVPSVRFSCTLQGDVFELYRRMRRFNASPYMFFMRWDDLTLFGSSPEVMVSCSDGVLKLVPIAGTRRRGIDEREDQFLASQLLHDPKERAEHVMLVDLGRNDLGKIAQPASVSVERFMQIERFSHVMHLTSTLQAHLKSNLDALDILGATFPAGTVSGAPKVRALELIREVEGCGRGPYAGCLGWLGLDKEHVNLDLGITIRSMWQTGDKVYWQAGGGIVHDSDPVLEWKEVVNKTAIMRLVLGLEGEEHVSANR